MSRWAHRRRIGVAASAIALAVAVTGCSAGARPAPQGVVEEYLDAIAAGDATTANSLGASNPGADSGTTELLESSSFMTDAVLGAATQRITSIAIGTVDDHGDTADVTAKFALRGTTYEHVVTVKWDGAAAAWKLQSTVTGVFSVYASKNPTDIEPLPFTLAGTAPTSLTARDVPRDFVAYPAVYPLAVDTSSVTLTDPAKTPASRDLVVGWTPGHSDTVAFATK